MKQAILVLITAATLAACSKTDDASKKPPVEAGPVEEVPGQQPDGNAACTLVANPEAVFGQPVTPAANTNPNNTVDCQWKSAEGRICGSLTVFGPGYNKTAADPKTNFEAMSKSMGAFGTVKDIPGIGEEARIVDGGMFGAQLAFHKGEHSALAASACSSGNDKAPDLAQKLATEAAGKL